MKRPALLSKAELHHAQVITDLTQEAYKKWVAKIGREPTPMGVDYAQALGVHRFDLASDGEELVGVIETSLEIDHLLIVNIAVRPDRQGLGLGHQLLAHAESLARSSGHRELRLYTNGAFTENIALYRQQGYEIISEEVSELGVKVNMSKWLAHPA